MSILFRNFFDSLHFGVGFPVTQGQGVKTNQPLEKPVWSFLVTWSSRILANNQGQNGTNKNSFHWKEAKTELTITTFTTHKSTSMNDQNGQAGGRRLGDDVRWVMSVSTVETDMESGTVESLEA